jgi:protein-tyrosine phosphatase
MAGMSRSVSYVIYYLIKKEKWDFYTALEYIKTRRPIANPNAGFRKQLTNL